MNTNGNHSCRKCSRRDSVANMVQCDCCDRWEHFDCAGVNDSIGDTNRLWVCTVCTEEAQAQATVPNPEVDQVNEQGTSAVPNTGAIQKVRSEPKVAGTATRSVVSISTSASSKKSQRIQMCLDILEETKKVKMRMLEEEEKYLQSKFDLLLKLGDEEDKESKRSGVSAKTKRERLEKWLTEGAKNQDTNRPVGNLSSKTPAASAVPDEAAAQVPPGKRSSVPTSKTQSVLKSLERFPPERSPQETSALLQVSQALTKDLISPTTTSFSRLAQTNQSNVWPPMCGKGKTPAQATPLVGLAESTSHFGKNHEPAQLVAAASLVDRSPKAGIIEVSTHPSVYSQVPFGSVIAPDNALRANTTLAFTSNSSTHCVSAGQVPSSQHSHPSLLPYQYYPATTRVSLAYDNRFPFDGSSNEFRNLSGQPLPPVVSCIVPNQLPSSVPSYVPGAGFVPAWTETSGVAQPTCSQYGYGSYPPQPINLGPTASQMAARQVMPRELPTFSGDPEDWPIFFSSFRNTSEVCGYSDAENLARLQRCLRGNALESVRSRLLLPASVPFVMETLRKLYGRPEVLINSLLKKVRTTPSPKADNLNSIVTFGLAVQNLIDHMVISDQQFHLSNPMLLQELVEKLPTSLKLQWGCYKNAIPNVNLATFNAFMSGLVNLASDLSMNTETGHVNTKTPRVDKHKEKLFVHAQEPPKPAISWSVDTKEQNNADKSTVNKGCTYCENSSHQIASCPTFKLLDIDGRWKAIRQKNLCRTCLIPHRKWPCRSNKECGKEGGRIHHHQLLHSDRRTQSQQDLPQTSKANIPNSSRMEHQNHHFNKSFALFRYLPVTIFGNGKQVDIFAFLDEGSSSTLIEAGIVEQLGIEGPLSSLWLSWTGNITREEKESRRVEVTICGIGLKKKFTIGNVQTVNELLLPKQSFDYEGLVKQYPYMKGLPLVGYSEVTPWMIIGLEHVRLLTTLKLREGGSKGPVAVKTRLGWCAYGKESGDTSKVQQLNLHSEIVSNQALHDMMKRFFEVEESTVTRKLVADEDKRALDILELTTIRKGNRFETGLLWRTDHPSFPDSLPMAMKRLVSLEKRLARNPELAEKVKEQIEAYEVKKYAHKASKEELEQTIPQRVWYLPLGVVTSEKKPDKIRLIWDAAAKAGGTSLNDLLLKGPDMLTPLPDVLQRFRERCIAVSGDICEMFHQVRIREEDKQALRFLFRNCSDEPVQTYVMDVATFGATCSPCSAQFIKNKNAQEFSESHPRAVKAIIDNHYVDDFLDCTDTEEEAVDLVQQVKMIHAAGGFVISKFRSNSPQVLAALDEQDASTGKPLCTDKQVTSERVLGLTWIPSSDLFTFDTTVLITPTTICGSATPTKRQVLRTVMKLFDPLGLISYYIVHGKILMQEIWRSGTDWDEPIADHLLDKWHRWIELLRLLGEVKVPRCFFKGLHSNMWRGLQLHVLVDASENSYACVAYLRLDCEGERRCALVGSKTKVAPLKPLSIPRLELQAALIGARLSQSVSSALTLPIERCYYWSDSSTVLSWLRSDSRRYHQYVSYRVGEILSITHVNEWRYVPSKLNVADEATKWGSGPRFDPDSRWFRGPSFLLDSEEQWSFEVKNPPTTNEELRAVFQHHNCLVKEPLIDASRFSNWNRLVRATAYVHRMVAIWRKILPQEQQGEVLQGDEILKAENTLWLQTQAQVYPDEVVIMNGGSKSSSIPKCSPLFGLTPFLDDQGIIRLQSRIEAAPYAPYETKYPIILPNKHRVTFLLVDSYHRRFLHGNNETVCNELRQRYYIPKLRSLIKLVCRTCQLCKINKAVPKPPIMAPLPKVRLTPFIRAFTFVGVDYFGPLEVKIARSLVKRWVALFSCLTVRAVHLELTHSLSTQSCILAIRRFVARRGAPKEVYTDNGTNFQGAGRRLDEEKQKLRKISEECATTFTNAYTTWYYNVPAAPHMGGPWERMVRAVKTAMKAIAEYPRHPSDEILETVLLEAEGVVNSRPLTYIPLEVDNQESLTPNHFLLYGSSGINQPAVTPVYECSGLRDSWILAQNMVDGFWCRWVMEYLPMLTRRTKWFEKVKPLEPGDLVVVVNENTRNLWERGRIIEVKKGVDGQVRRAVVQTHRGIFSRPAVKLALLDVAVGEKREVAVDRPGSGSSHGWGDVATLPGHNGKVEMTSNTHGQTDMYLR